jgi:hypothetical protein
VDAQSDGAALSGARAVAVAAALVIALTLAVGCSGSAAADDIDGGAGGHAGGGGGTGGNGGGGDLAGVDMTGPAAGPDMVVSSDVIDRLLALTANCGAANMVSSHTYDGGGVKNVGICALQGAVYFNADMDIDCDGLPTGDKCPGPDPSYLDDTAFHNLADMPLTAAVTPYVVIPNDFTYAGLENGGNVVAVIYDHKLQFAVFGDTGPTNIIGEASYACAEKLGINPNPAIGGIDKGVSYIVFTSSDSVPHDIEDQAEAGRLGEALVAKLLADN